MPNASGPLQTSEGLCESRGGRPGLPRPGLKVPAASGTLQSSEGLCESRGGCPGLPRPVPTASGPLQISQLPLVLYRSCVKVEVAVLGFSVPFLLSVL